MEKKEALSTRPSTKATRDPINGQDRNAMKRMGMLAFKKRWTSKTQSRNGREGCCGAKERRTGQKGHSYLRTAVAANGL